MCYVLDEDLGDMDVDKCSPEEHNIRRQIGASFGMSYLPNVPDQFEHEGYSAVKLSYLYKIQQYDYRRPHHNVVRNLQNKDEDIEMEFVTL